MAGALGGDYERLQDVPYPFGWVKPEYVLILFFLLSIMVYFDRGALAGCIEDVQHEFGINNTKGGILSGSYLFFYCIFSPIFAHIANSQKPMILAGWGMAVWVGGCVFTGLSFDFYTILIARSLTGVGEASFMCMASTVIDFVAPPESRSTWLACFYVAIPAGYAMGNVLGSLIASFGSHAWRYTFIGESVISILLVLSLFYIPGPANMLQLDPTRIKQEDDPVCTKFSKLATNATYCFIVLGYASQTFVVGGLTFWSVKYLHKVYNFSEAMAGSVFGAVALLSGLVGSIAGGILLDGIKGDEERYKQLTLAGLKLVLPLSLVAFLFGMWAMIYHNIYSFLICVSIAELAIFATVGPINNIVLWSVPIDERPFAMATTTLVIHILGDSPAPFIIGWFSDIWGWRTAMSVGTLWLGPPLLCFFLGYIVVMAKPNESIPEGSIGSSSAIQNALEEDSFMDAAPPVPVKEKSGLIQNGFSDATAQDRI